MPISPLFHWIQSTEWATAIRESELVYPVIMSLHLACIAFFGGLILMTDLRLLGATITSTPAAEVIARLRPWKRLGFIVMVTCGVLLASSKADTYYANPFFRVKMLLLGLAGIHALVFYRSVYARSAPAIGVPARLAAVLSLVLWIGILSMGRWIAYYEPPK